MMWLTDGQTNGRTDGGHTIICPKFHFGRIKSSYNYHTYINVPQQSCYLSNVRLVRHKREAIKVLPGDVRLQQNVDLAVCVLHPTGHLHLTVLVQQTLQLFNLFIANLRIA